MAKISQLFIKYLSDCFHHTIKVSERRINITEQCFLHKHMHCVCILVLIFIPDQCFLKTHEAETLKSKVQRFIREKCLLHTVPVFMSNLHLWDEYYLYVTPNCDV